MQTNKKTILLLVSLMPIFLLSNCVSVHELPEGAVRPDSIKKQQSASVAKRFQESAPEKPTVVESAMELSKKHAQLSEEAAVLRQQNRDIIARNRELEDKVVALDVQLQRAQKELNQANDLLVETRVELNNWKIDILGFRDEIRNAETAQLEALLRILKVLGGEAGTKSAKGEDTGPAVASLSKPGRPNKQ